MAIYWRKNSLKIIASTIQIDPGCYEGDKVIKIRASLARPRTFYVHELIADQGPEEITDVIQGIIRPERSIRPLAESERDAILHALALLSDDRDAAAQALRITRILLDQKLTEYETAGRLPAPAEQQTARRRDR